MKLVLESTDEVIDVAPSVPVRVWVGHTGNGIPVRAYVALVAVHRDEDATEFERELREVPTTVERESELIRDVKEQG